MNGIMHTIEKSIVFLGRFSQKSGYQFQSTGFLILVQNVLHLATAKHTIVDIDTGGRTDKGMQVFFNLKHGPIGSRSLDRLKKKLGVDWVFHTNKEVDLAVIPFALYPSREDVAVIPDDMFLPSKDLSELYDVFYVSYQPGIERKRKIAPIVRGGQISLINPDKTFYIDGFAFPGNSGSPVFLKPLPWRFVKGAYGAGEDPLAFKFVGMIGEYLPYQEMAISTQTGRPRIMFEQNTGLSLAWSVKFINEIIESRKFKEQCKECWKVMKAAK